jgi:hypothetical protein
MPPSIGRSDDRVSDCVGCRISLRNPRGSTKFTGTFKIHVRLGSQAAG